MAQCVQCGRLKSAYNKSTLCHACTLKNNIGTGTGEEVYNSYNKIPIPALPGSRLSFGHGRRIMLKNSH